MNYTRKTCSGFKIAVGVSVPFQKRIRVCMSSYRASLGRYLSGRRDHSRSSDSLSQILWTLRLARPLSLFERLGIDGVAPLIRIAYGAWRLCSVALLLSQMSRDSASLGLGGNIPCPRLREVPCILMWSLITVTHPQLVGACNIVVRLWQSGQVFYHTIQFWARGAVDFNFSRVHHSGFVLAPP